MDGGMNGSGSRESLGSSGQSWQDEARDVLGGSPSTSTPGTMTALVQPPFLFKHTFQ